MLPRLADEVRVGTHPGVAATEPGGERPQGGVTADPAGLPAMDGRTGAEHLQVGVAETGVVGDVELGHGDDEHGSRRRRPHLSVRSAR